MSRCTCCQREGADVQRKVSPILPGWPKGWGEAAAEMRPFHRSCYGVWYESTYWHLAAIDRSLNEAAGFVRDGDDPTRGVLAFEGEAYPCRSWWRGDEMEREHPSLSGREWWSPRRPECLI